MIANDYLESVLRPLRRAARLWRVGLMAAAVVMAGTLAASALGRRYRSEAVVYYREGLQWTESDAVGSRRIGTRLKDVLLARAQLARIIEELDLYPELVKGGRMSEAVEEMRLATGFKVSEGDIFVVSYTSDSPAEAQRVTARLTDALIVENARLRSEQAEVAREFLDAEKARNAAGLSAKETELLRFLAKHPEFAHEQSSDFRNAGSMGATLRATAKKGWDAAGPHPSKVDDTLGALRREEERLRRQISSPTPIPRTPRDAALIAAKNEAEAALRVAQRELTDRSARFTEQHPDVRSAAATVARAQDAYRRAVEALGAAEALEVEPRGVLEARLGLVRKEITARQGKNPQEKPAAAGEAEGSDAAQRIVALETEWARLNREVAEARERFQQLDSRQFLASMVASTTVSGQAGQIVVIDPAYVPARPVGMATKRLLLLGIAMALTVGLALAILFGALDDRVYDRSDVERLELAPVLVEVQEPFPAATRDGQARDRQARDGQARDRQARDGQARDGQARGGQARGGQASRARRRGRNASSDANLNLVRSWRVALFAALHGSTRIETLAPDKVIDLPADAAEDVDAGSQGVPALEEAGAAAPRALLVEDGSRDARSSAGETAPVATGLATIEPKGEGTGGATTALLPAPAPGREGSDLVRVHRAAPPRSLDPRLVMLAAPDSEAAAGFRVLRHRLGERRGLKVIMVASPGAGEGKTLCAVNLALALGEAGRARVVLLEANVRSPSLARLFGLRPPECVTEQLERLRDRPMQPWVVVESVAPWLHVAAVEPESEGRPLLDGPALTRGIEKLRRAGYDYIVIDSPAILGSADANLIEESADGILLAARVGTSRARALRTAVEQIGTSKLMGVALFGA